MDRLLRVTLWAYPRQFRHQYGTEWARTLHDLQVHSGHSTQRIAGTVVTEIFTAVRMRWENLMPPVKIVFSVITAVVALAALVIGSPAIIAVLVALAAMTALQFAGNDRPIAPTRQSTAQRWYLWLAAGGGLFLVGIAVVAIDGDDEDLSSVAWMTWLLSWVTGAVLIVVGLGLGATRLIANRR